MRHRDGRTLKPLDGYFDLQGNLAIFVGPVKPNVHCDFLAINDLTETKRLTGI
jgi:hypothetical protein